MQHAQHACAPAYACDSDGSHNFLLTLVNTLLCNECPCGPLSFYSLNRPLSSLNPVLYWSNGQLLLKK